MAFPIACRIKAEIPFQRDCGVSRRINNLTGPLPAWEALPKGGTPALRAGSFTAFLTVYAFLQQAAGKLQL